MRKFCFALTLHLFAFGILAHADDLSTLLHSCGKGAIIVTNPPLPYDAADPSGTNDGLWYRRVEYRTDGMFVNFTAKSKNGPWTYKNSLLKQMPCLASSGIVPTQTVRSEAYGAPAISHTSSNSASGDIVGGLALFGFLGLLYCLPIIVAGARNCKAGAGIAIVNVFLGWTFIGWVVALAWAASGENRPKSISTPATAPQMPPLSLILAALLLASSASVYGEHGQIYRHIPAGSKVYIEDIIAISDAIHTQVTFHPISLQFVDKPEEADYIIFGTTRQHYASYWRTQVTSFSTDMYETSLKVKDTHTGEVIMTYSRDKRKSTVIARDFVQELTRAIH